MEDPVRLQQFFDEIDTLSWMPADRTKSLNTLFSAVTKLAHAEIRYYFNKRVSARRASLFWRTLAWLLGSVGLLIPLIKPALPSPPPDFLSYGYIAFGLSGCFLVADTIFSGSEAHQRYVMTQLTIESLLTNYSIDWQALSIVFNENSSTEAAINLIERTNKFASSLHSSLQLETEAWMKTMKEAKEALKAHATDSSNNNG